MRSSFLLIVGVLIAGCAADKPVPAAPQSPGTARPPAAFGAAPTDEGPQYLAADAPTFGEGAVARPEMTPEAAQAYAAGLQAFQAGDLVGAKTQFRRALQADPKAYRAHYSLGVVLERERDVSGALRAYRSATSVVSDYEPAIVAYAVLLANTGKQLEAEEYLRSRQAKMPDSAAVLAALAEIKSIKGESGEAQRLAQEALKKNPDYRPAMVALARDHYRTRRLDLALYTLQGILDGYGEENPPRDKNNAEARLLRGLILKEQRRRAAAIEELRRAIELRPDLAEARVHLAAYLLESGNATEAAELLEVAVRYDPGHVLARLNLGDAYRLLGRVQQAKVELEWVAKTDPSLAQVHYNLGLLYLFSEGVPGVEPLRAAELAIEEFRRYREMRPRAHSAGDDAEELITRAQAKRALVEAQQAQPPPEAAPAAPVEADEADEAYPPADAAPPTAAAAAPVDDAPPLTGGQSK
jgi:Tfp pilus assembly protein PilF